MIERISALNEGQIVIRVLCSMMCAVIISYMTSKFIGPANKAAWFHKRTKYSFFLRRGILGEECHFGYPCKKEGFVVSGVMLAAIAIMTFIVFVI